MESSLRVLFSSALIVIGGCGAEESAPRVDPRIEGPLFELTNFNQVPPESFRARFETTKGDFVIEVYRNWAPIGSMRFYNLVRNGWYDGVRFHRVLEDFTAGFGIHDDPYVNAVWRQQTMKDDPRVEANTRGRVVFAKSVADTRTVQVFVNLKDNRASLDANGFAPFGEVIEGMAVVDALNAEYGDGPPRGEGVYQAMAIAKGAEYFAAFPGLDVIIRATIADDDGRGEGDGQP
jgi:peptidyl-prolyl cis-trans isomerase A (cyclophilin A)